MSKATRLIQLLHELRMYSPPVTAQTLAEAMAVSERTIYRDIDALRAAGAVIDGEAGFGYTLTEDPALPPQMFSHDEIEALVLGLREVREIADPALATAAESALAKLRATLPDRLKSRLEQSGASIRFRSSISIKLWSCWLGAASGKPTACSALTGSPKSPSQSRVSAPNASPC